MHPLVVQEAGNCKLLKILNGGMLPDHFLQDNPHQSLQSYVQDYLKEEVFEEELANMPEIQSEEIDQEESSTLPEDQKKEDNKPASGSFFDQFD